MAGLLAEKTIHLWAEPDAARRLKKDYRLVPVEINEQPLCGIAIPKGSFMSESILSQAPELGRFRLPETALALNLLRVAWDLGFGDARAKEIQSDFLERILHEA